jgi:hypothetical protein
VLVLHNPLFVGDYIHLYSLHKNLDFMTTCMISFLVICAIKDYMWLHDYVVELNLSHLVTNVVIVINIIPWLLQLLHVKHITTYMIKHIVTHMTTHDGHTTTDIIHGFYLA